ncbi:hypothetical protein [Rufibacter hautae]|uniref:Uncharacterized protein n=1 Tax=Rufibacter hautae TaxID=2595005 RepID=A0A5B6TDZ5_9BACT|nr:hypothetical protein [Rufibacter hautae]KAA3438368.1 hypothetical protein FOA19_14070 [Rufibacter hautae]
MKNLATILLLSVMLTQAFSKFFIVLDYEANKDFISKVLCINREKPQLHCNGKCYLMKKLKKAEQTQNPGRDKTQKQKQEITLYYQPFIATIPCLIKTPTGSLAPVMEGRPVGVHISVFHPPKLTA